jgi:hypothetical protein
VIAETKPERAAWSAAIAKVEQLQTDAEKGFATPMRRVAVRTASVVWVKCRATSSPNIGTAYQNRRSSAQIAALFTPRCSTAGCQRSFSSSPACRLRDVRSANAAQRTGSFEAHDADAVALVAAEDVIAGQILADVEAHVATASAIEH